MQNKLVTRFILFALVFYEFYALNVDNYVAFIEERSRDENFVEEYTKWSSNLLSQSGYLYGTSHTKFPCASNKLSKDNTIPTSVHALRPSDIKCVGAMGDSFTTGLGARGLTPIDLLFEDRGEMIDDVRSPLMEIFDCRHFLGYRWRLYLFTNTDDSQCSTTI